ncbi:uncharacterized protein LOC126968237 [Leptidea sinapis]|uniref:uncharacterized protein LOC126968237 n=1 Tax=Leptidea sinapis TaxID=189913 RepID=UPI002140BFAC|nr:uncharacterized protein LOC126968237 [Leptidea sinapis]XP_050669074.1 uncharacterized protein LOC126968237 [Leptidea sinapis]
MKGTSNFQLLTFLIVYTGSVHSIMVKFGTRNGPIEPPALSPQPPSPRAFRDPAPVWEERRNDLPDPNAHWRPQLFIPQPRYTQVIYNAQPTQQPLTNAQKFVNSYKPTYQQQDNTPQVLSSQSLPGFGTAYFFPTYANNLQERKILRQEDAKHNQIEHNYVDTSRDSSSDLLWKYEKDAVRRNLRNTLEDTARPVYQVQWPAYVHPRH